MVDDTISLDKFLGDKSSDSNHGQSSVTDFLGLHLQLSLLVLGIETKGIKLEVARKVFWIVAVGALDLVQVNKGGSRQNAGPVPWVDLAQATVQDVGVAVGGVHDGLGVNGLGQRAIPQFRKWPASSGLSKSKKKKW